MSVRQCPKCELRFTYQTELDAHCRDDHPEFRHNYPARHMDPGGEPARQLPKTGNHVARP